MSSPAQPMLDESTRAEITRFVAAVEKALGDRPADEVAELTDGLEADLTEAWAAEGTTPTQRFGSPEAYAADLRAAAGLPPRSAHIPRQLLTWRNELAGLHERMLNLPGAGKVAGWAKELQPAWWVVRGAFLLILVAPIVVGAPGDAALTLIVLFLALAVVSLRWKSAAAAEGRRRVALRVWNALAVIGLLFSWSIFSGYYLTYGEANSWYQSATPVDPGADGLRLGEQPVTNVFAYDQDGRPLTRVRLYDQDGRPLTVGQDWRETSDNAGNYLSAAPDSGDGPAEWNLFPLLKRSATPDQMNQTGNYGPPAPAPPPYQQVPALPNSAVPPPVPSPGPSPGPSASASPSTQPSVTPDTPEKDKDEK